MAENVPAPGLEAEDEQQSAADWAALLERMLRGLESGNRTWPVGRRKESVQRLLVVNRQDMRRLRQRLEPLVASWDADRSGAAAAAISAPASAPEPAPASTPASTPASEAPSPADAHARVESKPAAAAPGALGNAGVPAQASAHLVETVQAALPDDDERGRELRGDFAKLAERLARGEATPALLRDLHEASLRAQRLLAHRRHLLQELHRLCGSLTEGLVELSEDQSWAQGQAGVVRERLDGELSVRSVRAASQVLHEARARQQRVRQERDAARDALREMIPRMLAELATLDDQTGRFEAGLGGHVKAIGQAQSLEGLAGVVAAMVEETRAVQQVVGSARARMHEESQRAAGLNERVRTLEAELQRLSEEVTTDALTRVANRRGLERAFERECARLQRDPAPLTVGLIDIDNFKKLNDTLGHAAGDEALKSLAARVRESLRAQDTVARFGGEEFVVLLPGIEVQDGQQVLTRLQRALSASLFLHEAREVFVTFSAGVTAWRAGEPLQTALERADEALYEAKRTGKNRTCVA